MRLPSLLALSLLAAPVVCQNTFVSPITAATVEGSSNNVFPFASSVVRRYQQIHGDLHTNFDGLCGKAKQAARVRVPICDVDARRRT